MARRIRLPAWRRPLAKEPTGQEGIYGNRGTAPHSRPQLASSSPGQRGGGAQPLRGEYELYLRPQRALLLLRGFRLPAGQLQLPRGRLTSARPAASPGSVPRQQHSPGASDGGFRRSLNQTFAACPAGRARWLPGVGKVGQSDPPTPGVVVNGGYGGRPSGALPGCTRGLSCRRSSCC